MDQFPQSLPAFRAFAESQEIGVSSNKLHRSCNRSVRKRTRTTRSSHILSMDYLSCRFQYSPSADRFCQVFPARDMVDVAQSAHRSIARIVREVSWDGRVCFRRISEFALSDSSRKGKRTSMGPRRAQRAKHLLVSACNQFTQLKR